MFFHWFPVAPTFPLGLLSYLDPRNAKYVTEKVHVHLHSGSNGKVSPEGGSIITWIENG